MPENRAKANILRQQLVASPYRYPHKLDGIDGNGKPNTFTDEEMSKFKEALTDLAKRLSDFAMKM